MKKILFITPSKSIGGTNSSLSSLINFIQDKYDIKVLVMSDTGKGEYDFLKLSFTNYIINAYHTDFTDLKGGVKIFSLILKLLKRLFSFFSKDIANVIYKLAAMSIQRKYNFDIVVGFSERTPMWLASEFNTNKKITWVHCEYDRAISRDKDEIQYYQKFDNIVCVSMFTLNKFICRYPTLISKTSCVYNLLDYDRIITLSEESINDYRFKRDLFTIVSVGRMHPVKRFSTIPMIARTLLNLGSHFRWYIIGGPINDEYDRIKTEINKYAIGDYVIQLGNKVNPYPYMKSADLYVATSLSEACPMVFIESKICGLPIISTDFGSACEFIENEKDGFVVPFEQIAVKINSLIKNPCQLASLTHAVGINDIYNEQTKSKLLHLFS